MRMRPRRVDSSRVQTKKASRTQSGTPRQPSPRSAKLQLDSREAQSRCKCHFSNRGKFQMGDASKATKWLSLGRASEGRTKKCYFRDQVWPASAVVQV